MERTMDQTKQPQSGSRAVVIGSGIAGLSAARVLVRHFAQVTILDRDRLPDEPAFRSGIPQAHHAHTLMPYGQMVLEKLFPGLVGRLLAQGAQTIDDDREAFYVESGVWRRPEPRSARPTISCSRPMLESTLYRQMAGASGVTILQGYEVTGLVTDEQRERVVGIQVRSRQAKAGAPQTLPADLVVDASGRGSKAPQWLSNLGFVPPEEWRINAHAGYASRIYRQPEGERFDWKKLYVSPSPPDGRRGGVILPLEDNRWHVTLIGIDCDYPPTDEAGFLEFARSLSSPVLYDAIRAAEPLSKITGFRNNENRVRRYDHMPRYLEGLLVLGDAAYIMNPVYALGMTAAALSSQVLEEVLGAASPNRDATGLAKTFQQKLASSIATLWQQAVRSDWRWDATEISDNTEELYALAGSPA